MYWQYEKADFKSLLLFISWEGLELATVLFRRVILSYFRFFWKDAIFSTKALEKSQFWLDAEWPQAKIAISYSVLQCSVLWVIFTRTFPLKIANIYKFLSQKDWTPRVSWSFLGFRNQYHKPKKLSKSRRHRSGFLSPYIDDFYLFIYFPLGEKPTCDNALYLHLLHPHSLKPCYHQPYLWWDWWSWWRI